MQTWAKRGLQTALVTGGLLMLGTGIASADENVNPDTPASPLDLNVTVPIDEANNAIGTPLGQVDLPAHHNEISTKPVTSAVKGALASAKTPGGSAGSLTDSLPKADAPRQITPTHDAFKGNKVNGDVVVPIQIVDNAVGVIGDAHVQGGDHSQTYNHNQDVATDGKYSGIAGNVVALDYALPVQIAGNGVGLAGGSG
ncbi:PE-PGRS family protein, partial [Amycolatopsis sp. NPDC000740]